MITTRPHRSKPRRDIGSVHFGPGAFFRAFVADYTDRSDGSWGILGVSLRSAQLRDDLSQQDGVFTAVSLGPEGRHARQIEIMSDVLVAPENPDAVLAALASETISLVTMTITEKGYCHAPADGVLDLAHPDIAHDLANPDAPRSAIGFLVRGLALRKAAGLAPFTVLSCDNLPDNGALTRRLVLDFAGHIDTELATWIASEGRFPSSMVDRITPATTQTDIDALIHDAGITDPAMVVHEPFAQWVIEDNFVGDKRPEWDQAGAQFVDDVAPYEAMKLRCLNGTHSVLAYLGYLAGHETIAQATSDDSLTRLITHIWRNEIIPSMVPPQGVDLKDYCSALLVRYQNASIQHRTWQIAMDGSQKLPQRILGTVEDNLNAGRDCRGLILGIAAWMRYVSGVDDQGKAIDVRDPMAARLAAAYASGEDGETKVKALLEIAEIFPATLATHDGFQEALKDALQSLMDHGAARCIKEFL